jgi:CheY-like chemotaxis protein
MENNTERIDYVDYFDLTALLKLADLNVKNTAQNNNVLKLMKYFVLLSTFVNTAPNVSRILNKFAKIEDDKHDWKNIEQMITLLNELGCEKYLPDFYSISNAYAKGDSRLVSFYVKRIIDDFNAFSSNIISARKMTKNKADIFIEGAPDESASLSAHVEFLREQEANRKLLVLAVDDSPDILMAVATVLSSEYKVFRLPKPTMLENVLKQVHPELFLLDYQMPELNGLELIPIIRNLEDHKHTPIIFLTSEATRDLASAAIGMGACDFIVKPFNPDILREKVGKHIVRKIHF